MAIEKLNKRGLAGPVGGAYQRHPVMRIDAFLDRRSPAFVLTIGLALVGLIWVIDILSGPVLSPVLLYLVPVALVAWRLGRVAGAFVAAASAVGGLAGDLAGGLADAHSMALYWSAVMRLGVLLVLVSLVMTLKHALQRQRDLAAEEELNARGLRELNDVKDTLLHAISHDLRGPITAILGSVQTLERGEQLRLTRGQRAGLLSAISVSGRKLNRLVTDLLDLQRLDRGMIEPEREATDVAALARDLLQEADYLDEHPVRLEADPVIVTVDAGKVERIIDNLLVNAARHTPVGTPVMLSVGRSNDGVTISVEDEGPGIDDGLKATLFEPFHQGPEARSTGTGAGIGLSLVARFAELHGGRAWVEDRVGGGTAFRVHLPGELAEATRIIDDQSADAFIG
jgi:signal transduction histidine kinase